MRSLFASALALALAAPALAQTPPPETITFEGTGTPIPYALDVNVPATARLSRVTLAGGGIVRFRTLRGAKYVALVTQFGTTAIAAVSKKGKIAQGRYFDIQIRKARGARFDSMTPIQAGKRVDNKGTTDPSDDQTFYDGPGDASFRLYDAKKELYPGNGALLSVTRSSDPNNFVKLPYDLTTTSLNFQRIQLLPMGGGIGDVVLDDFVVSFGH